MKFQIKYRFTSIVLFETEADSFKSAVELAVKSGAYLGTADLRAAYLGAADLRGADLGGAKNVEKVKNPANDHYFISELLWRKAKTEPQKDFAARIRIDTNQCNWPEWAKLAKAKKVYKWAYKILAKWPKYKSRIEAS